MSPSTFLDVIPLYPSKTRAQVRADVDAAANTGLVQDDPRWVDTREGSMFYICTEPAVIEITRLWDALGTEVVAASKIATAWGSYLDLHAESYGLQRKAATYATGVVRFTGALGTLIASGVQVSPVQTDPAVEPPIFQTTQSGAISVAGFLDLTVEALDPGPDGNVAAGSVTIVQSSAPTGLASITNQAATSGGVDVETDAGLRERLQLEFQGKGGGNIADYKRWALAYPGVGKAEVVPAGLGAGTVVVIIADPQGAALSAQVISGLQAQLDPVPGQGKGLAPIGHTVTVQTVTLVTINVVGNVDFKEGYSLTGSTGGVPLQAEIVAALGDYINNLVPGDDVIYENVKSAFFDVVGVHDITGVTIAAPPAGPVTANIAISSSPPQSARLGSVTLTEI